MIVLRAFIRRDLMRGPKEISEDWNDSAKSHVVRLSEDFPLENAALVFSKASKWEIITTKITVSRSRGRFIYEVPDIHPYPHGSESDIANKALVAIKIWRTLEDISFEKWHLDSRSSKIRRVSIALGSALEDVMNHLFSSRGIMSIIPGKQGIPEWKVHNLKVSIDVRFPNNHGTLTTIFLHRSKTADGSYGRWKAKGFEPFLYMWTSQLFRQRIKYENEYRNPFWLFDSGDSLIDQMVLGSWICRRSNRVNLTLKTALESTPADP